MAAEHRFDAGEDWNWPESADAQVETDKPDHDGYGAVQLWAAYSETGSVRPSSFPTDWDEDAAWKSASPSPRRFPHTIGPEMWLPVKFESVFEAEDPFGNDLKIGSVFGLWEEMRVLNDETWRAAPDRIRKWREEDFDPEEFDSIARWGFSIWFCLTEHAVRNRLPMRLDY